MVAEILGPPGKPPPPFFPNSAGTTLVREEKRRHLLAELSFSGLVAVIIIMRLHDLLPWWRSKSFPFHFSGSTFNSGPPHQSDISGMRSCNAKATADLYGTSSFIPCQRRPHQPRCNGNGLS